MSLSRRRFLGSTALGSLAAALPSVAEAQQATGKRVVIVFCYGGWDVTYVMDPKFDTPFVDGPDTLPITNDPDDHESITQFGNLPICTNPLQRPSVTSFFERWAEQTTILNGIWLGQFDHRQTTLRALTGRSEAGRPDVAAIVGSTLGKDLLYPYVDLGGRGLIGQLGTTSVRPGLRGQFELLLPNSPHVIAPPESGIQYPLFTPDFDEDTLIQAVIDRRLERLKDQRGSGQGAQGRLNHYFDVMQRSRRIQGQTSTSDWIEFGVRSDLGSQLDTAQRLLQDRLTQSVLIDTRFEWDTHSENWRQSVFFEELFFELDLFVEQLASTGDLDDTLVLVCSEMSRTPKLNAFGHGKDHFHNTSFLLIGGGLPGNRVLGGTNEYLLAEKVDLQTGAVTPSGQYLRYDNLTAGLLNLFDIDSGDWLPGVEPFHALLG